MKSPKSPRSPSASDNIEKWLTPAPARSSSALSRNEPQSPSSFPSLATSSRPSLLGAERSEIRTSRSFQEGDLGAQDLAASSSAAASKASASRALSAAFAELKTSNAGVVGPLSTASSKALPHVSLPSSRWDQTVGSPVANGVTAGGMRQSASLALNGSSPRKYGQPPETLRGLGGPKERVPGQGTTTTIAGDNEKLYEAYNELHSLAQIFRKPFDAPAILIVGHQTDGKSALVEALMGFQFNHVGGGTKTRRPITLQMTYNPLCVEPRCFLVLDKELGREEQKTLAQLQGYIERENQRLEGEGGRFGEKEIVLRVEYKYCPNLTIIDTPGLISAAPGSSHTNLQDQAATVESLVVAKMQQREFVILCLEDSNDWNNATTRKVVMMVDPELSRTILVSTKLDTRIPQFSRAADVEMFLNPTLPGVSSARIGNKPFFTSVPSGRVGNGHEAVFGSDDQFREAVLAREHADVLALEAKMGRPLSEDERSRVGVSRLRLFLEQLLQHRYLESVPYIVPLLDSELKSVAHKLAAIRARLRDLSDNELKERSRDFRDKFMSQLTLLLRGTIAAPPEAFGETLEDERAHGGAFVGEDGQQLPSRHMPNFSMRLYGGAQYHRAMAEFRFVTGAVNCPVISREEIVNSCGVEDIHDGTNYYRTACVIAVKKAWDVFEPYLRQLGFRLSHIIRRLLPIVMYLLKRQGEPMLAHELFLDRVAESFHRFVDATEFSCIERCIEDLTSTTRFVSWTLHQKPPNQSGLMKLLGQHAGSAGATTALPGQEEQGAGQGADSSSEGRAGGQGGGASGRGGVDRRSSVGSGGGQDERAAGAVAEAMGAPGGGMGPQLRLADILEGSLWTKRLAPSSEELVNALVGRIFDGVRDHFVLSAELKFNCFFLMPLLDKYPARLREDLEEAAGGDAEAVFEITRARRQLEREEAELEEELTRMQALQTKFAGIHRNLTLSPSGATKFVRTHPHHAAVDA